jgi:hypothetical protein
LEEVGDSPPRSPTNQTSAFSILQTTSEHSTELFLSQDQVSQTAQEAQPFLSPLSVLDMNYSSEDYISDSGEESEDISHAHSFTGEVSPDVGGHSNAQFEQHHGILSPVSVSSDHHSVYKAYEADHVPDEEEVASIEFQKDSKKQDY